MELFGEISQNPHESMVFVVTLHIAERAFERGKYSRRCHERLAIPLVFHRKPAMSEFRAIWTFGLCFSHDRVVI